MSNPTVSPEALFDPKQLRAICAIVRDITTIIKVNCQSSKIILY